MKKWAGVFLLLCVLVAIGIYLFKQQPSVESPLGKVTTILKPLNKYTFVNLHKYQFPASDITIGKQFKDYPTFTSYIFYYNADVALNGKLKKISGLMNVPKAPGTYPIIVMNRGYVPPAQYFPGDGTQPAATVFAENGFITLAPDFLGYGESDPAATDGFENRFQTYTTDLSLLASLKNLNTAFTATGSSVLADLNHINVWGHSNGGHITLSVLAISQKPYPTVLWAPVSQSFPYSILYYTDEYDDRGKATRKSLAQFETLYNTDDFDPQKYYKWIKAPIEVNQGTADVEVPYWWSDLLVNTLKKQGNDVTYFTYPGADHNLLPVNLGWNQAVQNSLQFFQQHLISSPTPTP